MLVLGTYYAAVIENCTDFVGRVVVDVGAGSEFYPNFTLSFSLPHFFSHISLVIKGKIEEVELPEKADILISEPMEDEPILPPLKKEQPRNRWDDEDVDENDVKDSWEDKEELLW
ncbi:hypothetical protein ACSBR1_018505 [Camellia fascicularis]